MSNSRKNSYIGTGRHKIGTIIIKTMKSPYVKTDFNRSFTVLQKDRQTASSSHKYPMNHILIYNNSSSGKPSLKSYVLRSRSGSYSSRSSSFESLWWKLMETLMSPHQPRLLESSSKAPGGFPVTILIRIKGQVYCFLKCDWMLKRDGDQQNRFSWETSAN